MALKVFLHLAFDVERQAVLHQPTDFTSVLAVAIAHRKEVAVLEPHDVGRCDVGVLIHFVGIVSGDAPFRCKRKLRHHITYFAFSSTLLFGLGCFDFGFGLLA